MSNNANGCAFSDIPQELLQKKGLIKCLLLSVVTLGIYALVWLHSTIKKIKLLNGESPKCAGEMLLCMFVPFYIFYWSKTRGQKLREAADKYNIYLNDNSGFYLFSCICPGYINVLLFMQNDFNTIAGILSYAPPAEVFHAESAPVEAAVTVAATATAEAPSQEPVHFDSPVADVMSGEPIADEPSASVEQAAPTVPLYVARTIAAPGFKGTINAAVTNPTAGNSALNDLKRLNELYSQGGMSAEEYNTRKAELMKQI